MEEVNLKQFLIEIGIRQEAAELIDLAFPHPKQIRVFKRLTKMMMNSGKHPKEAVAETWMMCWEVSKRRVLHSGPKPTQAYIDML